MRRGKEIVKVLLLIGVPIIIHEMGHYLALRVWGNESTLWGIPPFLFCRPGVPLHETPVVVQVTTAIAGPLANFLLGISIGAFFKAGELKVGYIEDGDSREFFLLPHEETVVVSVAPNCSRDRIMRVLKA